MNFHGNYRYLIDNLNQKRIGFNTITVLGVNMRVIVIGLFSIFLMLFSMDSVLAESDEVDTSIGFDFTFGEIIENEKILSGSVVSSNQDVEVSWEIYNSTGFKYNLSLIHI